MIPDSVPPKRFSLKPFPGERNPADAAIGGTIARTGDLLSVRFEIRGNLALLSIPPPSESPERRDRLWETTCLELFAGTAETEGYLECNLSPSGHWNVYRFARYREGMAREDAIPSLPFQVRNARNTIRISLDLAIGRVVPPGKTLQIGAAAVLRAADGGISRWALAHPRPVPDFHDRNGFVLTLLP
ncbi:MAG: hypothetical protein OHK0028_23460 [Deltaproteobacteria bacterium]